jgi:hypothetical protein
MSIATGELSIIQIESVRMIFLIRRYYLGLSQ